ncbi:hypothetical protein TNCV_3158221 [Trichonephila clavipes]|nr:hypothetical protein TNCV_3158221 [Trichonephila clavipes]
MGKLVLKERSKASVKERKVPIKPVSIEMEPLKYNDMGLIRELVNEENKYPSDPLINIHLKSKTSSCSHIIPAPNIKLKDKFNKE